MGERPSGFGRRVNAEHLSRKFLLSIAQQKPKRHLQCPKLQSFFTVKIQHRVYSLEPRRLEGAAITVMHICSQVRPSMRERILARMIRRPQQSCSLSLGLGFFAPKCCTLTTPRRIQFGVSLSWSLRELSPRVLVVEEIRRDSVTKTNR